MRASAEQARRALYECDDASAARERAATKRDGADKLWHNLLGEARPNLELVRIGGNWLLDQQREFESCELDLAISANRLEKARQDHAQALGREGAARKSGVKARKSMEKTLEERQSARLADSLLWRWQK